MTTTNAIDHACHLERLPRERVRHVLPDDLVHAVLGDNISRGFKDAHGHGVAEDIVGHGAPVALLLRHKA